MNTLNRNRTPLSTMDRLLDRSIFSFATFCLCLEPQVNPFLYLSILELATHCEAYALIARLYVVLGVASGLSDVPQQLRVVLDLLLVSFISLLLYFFNFVVVCDSQLVLATCPTKQSLVGNVFFELGILILKDSLRNYETSNCILQEFENFTYSANWYVLHQLIQRREEVGETQIH